MKRFICMIAALILAASLAACSEADKTSAPETAAQTDKTTQTAAATESETADLGDAEIDLTSMNSTMVYSQVYDMLVSPDDYLGKTVKMNGAFSIYQTDERNYYACIIKDATACCSQGIEFVLDGKHDYPSDYPALGTDITVTGVFDTYFEGDQQYVQLIHAKMG